MPCKHGLNEVNCPICRIENSITPNEISMLQKATKDLRPNNPHLDEHLDKKKEFEKRVYSSPNYKRISITDLRPTNQFINGLPDFRTKAFKERLENSQLGKMDKFGISKKVEITSPEFQYGKKENTKE